uniref:Glutathione peroxidase 4a n=1 Tax=Sinocyclocheilus grahami TaxID=75366 RepID=A0A672T081_SINGR
MRFLGSAVVFSLVLQTMSAPLEDWESAKSIYEFTATDIDGNEASLEKYRNQEQIPKSRNSPSLTTHSLICSVRLT